MGRSLTVSTLGFLGVAYKTEPPSRPAVAGREEGHVEGFGPRGAH